MPVANSWLLKKQRLKSSKAQNWLSFISRHSCLSISIEFYWPNPNTLRVPICVAERSVESVMMVKAAVAPMHLLKFKSSVIWKFCHFHLKSKGGVDDGAKAQAKKGRRRAKNPLNKKCILGRRRRDRDSISIFSPFKLWFLILVDTQNIPFWGKKSYVRSKVYFQIEYIWIFAPKIYIAGTI